MRKILLLVTAAGGIGTFLWLRAGGDLGQVASSARDAFGGGMDPATDRLDG